MRPNEKRVDLARCGSQSRCKGRIPCGGSAQPGNDCAKVALKDQPPSRLFRKAGRRRATVNNALGRPNSNYFVVTGNDDSIQRGADGARRIS
jgi:hypothetical protein